MRRVPRPADARAAWWSVRALRSARAQLRAGAVRDVRVAEPPSLPASAGRGVHHTLRRLNPSCLEQALVEQRWFAAHGIERDVIVGTEGGHQIGFAAHAWLDGAPQPAGRQYVELLRLAP